MKRSSPFRASRLLVAVWWLALPVAVVNTLFVLRRAPIMRRESRTPDENAAQSAADWMREEPAGARLLLMRSHEDVGAIWFNYRLNYLIYPRGYDTAWDPPADAARRYDLILMLGAARRAAPAAWTAVHRTGFATLYRPGKSPGLSAGPTRHLTAQLTVLNVIAALFSLAAIVALGALLLGVSTRAAPFEEWWANLATAHLVGATALTWLVTLSAIVTQKLAAWPVYALLLLLTPAARRALARLSGAPGAGTAEFGSADSQARHTRGHLESPSPETAPMHYAEPATRRTRVHCFLLAGVIGLGLATWAFNGALAGVGWDGYSNWQFKAQALLHDGTLSVLRDPHYADYAHFDYPLLVPLQTWWVGVHAGGYRETWAQGVGITFALDLLAIFIAFAGRWVRRGPMLLGASLLVTLPVLTVHAASGFADIEMACWLLALAVFLTRVTIGGERSQRAVLAWLFAGCVLVKNEGLLAAAAGLAVVLVVQQRRGLADACRFGVAACAAYLPWLVVKRAWRLKNDLLEAGGHPRLTPLLALWRAGTALRGFAACLARTGPRAGGWGLLLLLLPIGLVQTIRGRLWVCAPLWLLCSLQAGGYVLIYMITPHDLRGHIAGSVDRLTLHLVPTMLLASLIATFHDKSVNVEHGA